MKTKFGISSYGQTRFSLLSDENQETAIESSNAVEERLNLKTDVLPLTKKASIFIGVEKKMRPETAVTKLVKPRLNKTISNQVN